jgi:hypothetical protein
MALSTTLVPLAVAFVGLCGAVGGVMFTQIRADRRARLEHDREDVRLSAERERENVRWSRERDREEAAWAHEDAARSYERTQQRLADSYFEVLRIVEREGQWVEASITSWKLAAELAEIHSDRDHIDHAIRFERVEIPAPAITDRATIAAHLAAVGSDNVRKIYHAWRSTTDKIELELISMKMDKEDGVIHTLADLRDPLLELHFTEVRARQALADAIAKELGHR